MFAGLYRAEIATVEDEQERYRYRVRVLDLHDSSIPADHLPFASLATFVGLHFGDVPHFEIDDRVIVAFEKGERDHPIILGGWVTSTADVAGNHTPDFPKDQSDVYNTRRKNWDRQDRDGNRLRLTEGTTQPDEVSVELSSLNKLRVVTEQGDLEISIAGNGAIVIQGDVTLNVSGKVDVTCDEAEITAATKIVINSGDVQLGLAATDPIVTEARMKAVFDAHIHTDSLAAPTTPPTIPIPPASISSPNVKAS